MERPPLPRARLAAKVTLAVSSWPESLASYLPQELEGVAVGVSPPCPISVERRAHLGAAAVIVDDERHWHRTSDVQRAAYAIGQ